MPESPNTSRDLSAYSAAGFDRGASRLKEALWLGVRWVFFETSLPWPSALRAMLLRIFGAEIGAGVVIRGRVNITFPWRVRIGDNAWIGEEVLILSLARVEIGESVCISQRVFICTGSHDYTKPAFDLVVKPVTLRRGAWVAAQAFVGPGVKVGEGSVVSAGSVVVENVAPRVLVRGNPAVVVKEIG